MTRDFNWEPGIGDPTIGGWVTVVLYLLACVSCWKTAGVALRQDWNGQSDSCVWRAISIVFFLLGINKQLDLQSAMTELGRIVAFAGGWYEQRQIVQIYFSIGVAAICVTATLFLLFWARKSKIQTWLALFGSTFVLGYVLIRAASFHHIDYSPGHADIALHSHRGHRAISGRSRSARRAAQPPEPSRAAGMTTIPALPAPRQLAAIKGASKRGKARVRRWEGCAGNVRIGSRSILPVPERRACAKCSRLRTTPQ